MKAASYKLLTLWVVLSSTIALAKFPYTYTPEQNLPEFQKVRVEGKSAWYWKNPVVLSRYATKAKRHKFTAPQEMFPYIHEQKKLLAADKSQVSNKRFDLAFVGDIMWLRKDWTHFLPQNVLSYLNSHEVVLGNLESPISKSFPVPSLLPARAKFNSHPSLVTEFKRPSGKNTFSALSIANNHSLDYGERGIYDTIEFLNSQRIPWSGLKANTNHKRYTPVYKNGVKMGFYASTYGMNDKKEKRSHYDFNLLKGMAPHKDGTMPDLREVRHVLKQMDRDGMDLKIISLHWGHEYEHYPEPRQMVVAREIIKAGADIIMGHHSHAQQPAEICYLNGYPRKSSASCQLKSADGKSRKALVIYSLGNFLSNMYGFANEISSVLSLDIYKQGSRTDWRFDHMSLLMNEKQTGKRRHRTLMFMGHYLDQNCFNRRGCQQDDMNKLNGVMNLYPRKKILLRK